MALFFRRRSIQTRFTATTAALSLIFFTLIAIGLSLMIRNEVRDRLFGDTQRVATDWIASMKPGPIPSPTPNTAVNLLQLVDSRGRVVAASPAAAGMPPLSAVRPLQDDRIIHLTECLHSGCFVLTAVRVSPQEASLLWRGEPHVVYAGTMEPPALSTNIIEFSTLAAALLATGFATWITWTVVGRALRPVAAIRERMSEISVTDLSLRVPEPPGSDEIGQLARIANQTLAQLETAVHQQRHFASIVSHELKTPVAGLQTQLEEAVLYPDDVDLSETIKAGLATTERLRALIDDTMVFARIRTAAPEPPEPVDLGALVHDELVTTTRDVPVRTCVKGEVTVLGNHMQLIGVLNNLVVNAQRHAITSVEVSADREDGQAVVTVSDDGDGIAPEDRDRVFQPFVRLEEGSRKDPTGTGLGLAISRAIATAHHGTLEIDDSTRGACFVLRLPLLKRHRA
ncbi:HAMP domain-containing sensor histidine kinase [Herbidospora sp. NBRC 101105]|uniref:sensor histidine kinase n=1 Tax=Herbidospora sp. NBRC 101105 TaxID=3032195 RepID=UPI0024A1608E|nr:HAMP domain-containing sensor histidine kinase [Herbidospora sp. NBRC 101105]GLX97308.1 two-component sensor histidine kinase [Herbidospora sp. NBRC 101105]